MTKTFRMLMLTGALAGAFAVSTGASAKEIYTTCTDKLRTPEYRAQAIMKRMNVEIVCTTGFLVSTRT